MILRVMIRNGSRNWAARWRLLVLALAAATMLGCASTDKAAKEPTPRDDFKEYRHLVVQAIGQLDTTLRALDALSIQADHSPRSAYDAFAKAVHRLEVDSIRVRARIEAMRTRGAAYFEHWENYLAGVPDEQVRKLAKEHHDELKQSFEQARKAAQQVREQFRPFLSDLQKLRAVLEAEPSLAQIDAQKNLILTAQDRGHQVEQGLDRILAELNSMVALLRPAVSTQKP